MKFLFLLPTHLIIFNSSIAFGNKAADTLHFSLQEIVMMAKEKSIAARQAQTLKETRYWEWMTYKSHYQPQLALNGTLPGYKKSFVQVQQPNGTIDFQPVRNNNSLLTLSLSQTISATGGTIYGTSEMQRFDDFDRKITQYNGVPYGMGYIQPLFGFNKLRWDKRINPLKYKESQQEYYEAIEQISILAAQYFFDLLLAQEDFQIAETNLMNTSKILEIADIKFEMGKITKNEILQLQLEQLKAKKALVLARKEMQVSAFNLKSFIGLQSNDPLALSLPPSTIHMKVAQEKVIEEAYHNRSDAIAFIRRIEESKRITAQAKGDNGLNATLTARVGFSKGAPKLTQVYVNPQDQQLLQLAFEIPILDWGRQKARTMTALANQQFTEYSVEQDRQNFAQRIVTEVTLFEMMKDHVILTSKADSIASEKYLIAKERYMLGNLSITDLSIAFREKDEGKRDYINALRNFWGSYYQIRYLSLYDFENNTKIIYIN